MYEGPVATFIPFFFHCSTGVIVVLFTAAVNVTGVPAHITLPGNAVMFREGMEALATVNTKALPATGPEAVQAALPVITQSIVSPLSRSEVVYV